MKAIQVIATVLILSLSIYVAFSPNVFYAPTPKIVLYFLVSFLPGLLFGSMATAQFKLSLPGFAFTTAGVFAVCFGGLLLLVNLSKPEEQIAVYDVLDESEQPISLEWKGAVELKTTSNALSVTMLVDRNSIVLVFPEQASPVRLYVRKSPTGPVYSGLVSYAGNRTMELILGKQLISKSQ